MIQKGQTAIFLLVGILVVVITGGVLFYTNYSNNRTKITNPLATLRTLLPTSIPNQADETANWKIYTNTKYGFEIKHPDGWLLTTNITDPFIPSQTPLFVENLYSQRSMQGGPEGVAIAMAVYTKPNNFSFRQWLSKDVANMNNALKMSAKEVLQMVYKGETGVFTYDEYKKDNILIAELGGVTTIKGMLSYAAYLTKLGMENVYVLEIHIPYNEELSDPTDEDYIKLFYQILSTFKFVQ